MCRHLCRHADESDSANVVLWVLNNVDVYSDYAPWPTGICLQSATSPDSPSHYHTKSDFWKVYPAIISEQIVGNSEHPVFERIMLFLQNSSNFLS